MAVETELQEQAQGTKPAPAKPTFDEMDSESELNLKKSTGEPSEGSGTAPGATSGDAEDASDDADASVDDQEDEPSSTEGDDAEEPEGSEEESDEEDESEEESGDGDEDVVISEEHEEFINRLDLNEDDGKYLREHFGASAALEEDAISLTQTVKGYLQLSEHLENSETRKEAMGVLLDTVAETIGATRQELLSQTGLREVADDAEVADPEFLNEDNAEGFIDEALKPLNLDTDEQIADARLGAQTMLTALKERMGDLIPPDYQDWKQDRAGQKEAAQQKAEAAKAVEAHFNTVAATVKRKYAGFKLQKADMLAALEAFPQLTEQPYSAVTSHLEDRLLKFTRKKAVKRAKRQMPDTPTGAQAKPQARKKSKWGYGDKMKFDDA